MWYITYPQEYSTYTSPSPLKSHGESDRPVVMVPLLMYTDDTSGNRSKKWNKFDCWCFLLADMPQHENAKMHNIHFVTCSNQTDPLSMMEPIIADLKDLRRVSSLCLKKDVLLVAHVMGFLCDNPRHSEVINHAGGCAKKYCRTCMVCYSILWRSLSSCEVDFMCTFSSKRLTKTPIQMKLL